MSRRARAPRHWLTAGRLAGALKEAPLKGELALAAAHRRGAGGGAIVADGSPRAIVPCKQALALAIQNDDGRHGL